MTATPSRDPKALELARAFDRSFAEAPPQAPGDLESLLAVSVAGGRYALRVGDLAALVPLRDVVALPGPAPELLGLAAVRGDLVPVYSLAALLGLAPAPQNARWLAVLRFAPRVGLAFDELDGHLQQPRSAFFTAAEGASVRRHVSEFVRWRTQARAVVDAASLMKAVTGEGRGTAASKEE